MTDPIERPDRAAAPAELELTDRERRALVRDEDLPVVARLVIEIRSDGTRTLARGAIEDVATGNKTAIVARGGSPLALAADLTRGLARGLTSLPRLALLRRLLGGGSKR